MPSASTTPEPEAGPDSAFALRPNTPGDESHQDPGQHHEHAENSLHAPGPNAHLRAMPFEPTLNRSPNCAVFAVLAPVHADPASRTAAALSGFPDTRFLGPGHPPPEARWYTPSGEESAPANPTAAACIEPLARSALDVMFTRVIRARLVIAPALGSLALTFAFFEPTPWRKLIVRCGVAVIFSLSFVEFVRLPQVRPQGGESCPSTSGSRSWFSWC